MGVYTGIHRDSWLSKVFLTVSLIGISLPTFLIGILLIYVFAVWLGVLPSFGRGEVVRVGFWRTGLLTASGLKALILPAITLGLFQMTLVTRLVRAEMLEVLRTDYIKFARARGLPERAINFGHALKNTLVPVITVIGLQLGAIIAFAIITETVFQWPGMGLMFIQAVQNADIPVMAAYLHAGGVPVRAHQLHRRSDLRARRPAHPHLSAGAREGRCSDAPESIAAIPPLRARRASARAQRAAEPAGGLPRQRSAAQLPALQAGRRGRAADRWLIVGAAFLAPLIAPHDPYDLKSLSLLDANTPPAWEKGGDGRFLLGTDDQGRDILSTILYGTRSSLLIGICSVLLAGRASACRSGCGRAMPAAASTAVIMRIADVQLTFPAILTALLIDGVALAIFKNYRMRGRQVLDPGARHRPVLLGAICAHRARRDAGGAQQGIRARRRG